MKKFQLTVVWIFLFFTCIASSIHAQVPELITNKRFQQDAKVAIDSLYNFNFKGSERQIASWKKKYPNDPIWKLIDAMKFWWQIISDLNATSHDKHFIKMMKQADYAASKVLYKQHGNADALLVRTAANGFIARLYSDRDEWIKSLRAAHKAYKVYGVLKKNIPALPDLKLTKGLKLYYSAYLPKAYPVVKTVSMFLPKGNEQKGLQCLREASKNAIFAKAEATYFLGDINLNYEHNYKKAIYYFKKLYHNYPRNNYYARLLVRSEYKVGQYDDALHVIDESLQRWKKQNIPYQKILKENLLYWKGRIFYHNKKYDQALPLFAKSFQLSKKLPRSQHRKFYVEAAYYSGMILEKQGKKQKAIQQFKLAKKAKVEKNFQKKAQTELEHLQS
ncbi:MAG TPA: tetratricopeptide repeat protein [Balneolaceae bacterium]|nr:tetratricopeptide repeat protein [Balneolaceae bacterium]